MKQYALQSGVALTGTAITFFVGAWSQMLTLLLTVIIIDYITGLMSAVIHKNLSSSIGFKGIIKKVSILLIVVLSYQLDKFIGSNLIMTTTILFFITNELISIIENYGKIGLPLPPQLKKVINMLKEKQDNDKTL